MRAPRGLTVAERLARLSATGPTGPTGPTGCIVWTGSTDGRMGYGKIRVDGRMVYAHRVAYELVHGPIPAGQVIRHRCDNPSCVNTAHLEVGTQADNVRDMHARGRASNRLTTAQVEEIRRLHALGATGKDLARTFDVSTSQISNITTNKQWKESA